MYGDNQVEAAGARALVDHRPPSVTERLENEKKELELRLQAVNQLLDDLNQNPDTASIIDQLSQLGHRIY